MSISAEEWAERAKQWPSLAIHRQAIRHHNAQRRKRLGIPDFVPAPGHVAMVVPAWRLVTARLQRRNH